jgi:hypothetical protein
MSENVAVKMSVMLHEGEKIGWGRGITGVLFITDKRLAFVKLVRKKAFLRYRYEECPENLDDALKNEGSFEIPIRQITEAAPDTILMTPYMRIRYNTDSGEKVFSFILSMTWTGSGVSPTAINYYKALAEVIEQAKNGTLAIRPPITDKNVNTPELLGIIKNLKTAHDHSAK